MTSTNYDLKIKKRIQLVHIAASELGLLDPKRHETDPEDEYHLILKRWSRPGTRQPVTSSTQMSYEQLGELLDFLKALGFKIRRREATGTDERRRGPKEQIPQAHNGRTWKKYDSSMQGLKDEICNLAWVRWGGIKPGPGIAPDDVWERPLNSLCNRFGVKRWQWLDVAHGKEIKSAILRLQRADENRREPAGTDEGRQKPASDDVPI